MVILLLAVEREILVEQEIAGRDQLMRDEAQAYRERGRWLEALGRRSAAESDRRRAEQMEEEARALAEKATPPAKPGAIEVTNRWHEPVTLLIDGVSYRLAVGENKVITRPAGTFRYELPATKQISQGEVESGKTFRLQIK